MVAIPPRRSFAVVLFFLGLALGAGDFLAGRLIDNFHR
jgi:hypothetical protein